MILGELGGELGGLVGNRNFFIGEVVNCHRLSGCLVLPVDVIHSRPVMKLLEVQSSVRQVGSISRQLSQTFIQAWQQNQADRQHQLRDVGLQPPSHPTALWAHANYMEPEARSPEMVEALAESERLLEELFWCDRLLLGVPMYNFSVPSTLKAYIDNVVRVNRTFAFDSTTKQSEGLLKGRKALVITPSAGNFVVGTPLGELNFCDSYLRSLLGFIGIDDVTVVPVPDQFMGDEIRQKSIETAQAKLLELAMTW